MLRILLADDHEIVRRGLKELLEGVCHVMDRERTELNKGPRQAATPAAFRHASNASARKSRCVRAVVRWRGTVKVL